MEPLRNPVQHYAWGSTTAIPELLGVEPDGTPQAELWMGAHPSAPSSVLRDGRWQRLDEVIAADPELELGADVAARFAGRLPFLLKVLAVAEPLSLQAHPNLEQAVAGFEREEAAGIARDAPERTYRDASHKPELICALTPFRALCGLRPAAETEALLHELGLHELAGRVAGDGVAATLVGLYRLDRAAATEVAAGVAAACAGSPLDEARVVTRLAERYPGDVGVAVALLLNLVRLAPGEGLFLPAGTLHAYLEGMGVEVMANSDNVLRGGLTPKHVDVAELLRILDPAETVPRPLRPVRRPGGEEVFETPAAEFELAAVVCDEPGQRYEAGVDGPEIVLSVAGPLRGCSWWVGAWNEHGYALSGPVTAYRARVPQR